MIFLLGRANARFNLRLKMGLSTSVRHSSRCLGNAAKLRLGRAPKFAADRIESRVQAEWIAQAEKALRG
jgi:hypothetical protein